MSKPDIFWMGFIAGGLALLGIISFLYIVTGG